MTFAFTLAALSACGTYWVDTQQIELGTLTVSPSKIGGDGSVYRLDRGSIQEISGVIRVEGLEAVHGWNQVVVTVEWSAARAGSDNGRYGVSLWDLNDTASGDGQPLALTAVMAATQLVVSSEEAYIYLEDNLEPPEDGETELPFSLGLVVEYTGNEQSQQPALSGPALLQVTVSGPAESREDPAPTLTLDMGAGDGGDTGDTGLSE